MKTDRQIAISQITRAAEALRQPRRVQGEAVARMAALVRVLNRPPASMHLEALVATTQVASDALEKCRIQLVEGLAPRPAFDDDEVPSLRSWSRLVLKLHQVAHQHKEQLGAAMTAIDAFERDLSPKKILWGQASRIVDHVIALQDRNAILHLQLEDLAERKLIDVVNAASNGVSRFESIAPMVNSEAWKHYQAAKEWVAIELGRAENTATFMRALCRGASLAEVWKTMQATDDAVIAAVQGTATYAEFGGGALQALVSGLAWDDRVAEAEYLANAVIERLQTTEVPEYGLHRLVVYLENFAKERLREDVAAAKAGRREAVVQRYVDSFLFSEGFLPITHAEASGGLWDTFFDRQEPLFAEVEKTHQPPIMLELKQHAGYGTARPGELAEKIRTGLGQAETYASRVRAQRGWHDVGVTVLLVYDGPTRFRCPDHRVRLAYLGDAVPSDGVETLELA